MTRRLRSGGVQEVFSGASGTPCGRVRQLEVLALQAAESIQRAHLFDATERMATTDGLTGLLNAKGIVDFNPAQTFTGVWADITGATLTLALTATCTVVVFAAVTGHNTLNGSGRICAVRAVVEAHGELPDEPGGRLHEAREAGRCRVIACSESVVLEKVPLGDAERALDAVVGWPTVLAWSEGVVERGGPDRIRLHRVGLQQPRDHVRCHWHPAAEITVYLSPNNDTVGKLQSGTLNGDAQGVMTRTVRSCTTS